MQNFASPASKFCHLIAGQKLVKTHFAASGATSNRFMAPMRVHCWRSKLPMNPVAQPSRLRVRAASRRSESARGGTPCKLAGEDACATPIARGRSSMREFFRAVRADVNVAEQAMPGRRRQSNRIVHLCGWCRPQRSRCLTNAERVFLLTWCSMPSASRWATASGTPSDLRTSTTIS